ncbi:hypothetical protein J6590_028106, partial [Homalodisca vitripennis]
RWVSINVVGRKAELACGSSRLGRPGPQKVLQTPDMKVAQPLPEAKTAAMFHRSREPTDVSSRRPPAILVVDFGQGCETQSRACSPDLTSSFLLSRLSSTSRSFCCSPASWSTIPAVLTAPITKGASTQGGKRIEASPKYHEGTPL